MIKKFAATGLALMMAASLAGCGSGNQNTAPAGRPFTKQILCYLPIFEKIRPIWEKTLDSARNFLYNKARK